MIEVGRRGFVTGLAALVAAPAVIRVAPLMPISTRRIPMYVPVNWLLDELAMSHWTRWELELHAWQRPLGPTWVDLRDHDPDYVRAWARSLEEEADDCWSRWS